MSKRRGDFFITTPTFGRIQTHDERWIRAKGTDGRTGSEVRGVLVLVIKKR